MFECKAYPGVLYEAGGLADQLAGLTRRMRAAYNVWCAVVDWKSAKNRAEWAEKNPDDWKIVQLVITLREAEKRAAEYEMDAEK